MATTTPNFGWPVPTSTDLVKDGATAIESLGDSIDASLLDLKGGTSGQVLSKNSNTDMDFTWVTSDDANAIQNTIVDAKGDLIAASASDVPARLAVGANDLVLTAASGEATGLKWAGAWQNYTPTYNGITVGNGTVVARYAQIGKTVTVHYLLTFGSTTSFSGSLLLIKLPTNASANYVQFRSFMGNSKYYDTGSGESLGYLDWYNDAYGVRLLAQNTSATYSGTDSVSPTLPWTWTTTDSVSFTLTYEAA